MYIARVLLIFLMFIGFLKADEIGFDAKVGSWSKSIEGDFRYGGGDIDVENNLSFQDNSNLVMSISVDHFIPLIPNVKIELTKIDLNSNGTIKDDFTFSGTSFSANDKINQSIILDQSDIYAYYRFLDNYIRFYFGVDIKNIDGDITLGNTKKSFSTTIPLLYSQVALDFDTIRLIGEVSYMSLDSTISDTRVYMQYESRMLPLFKLGAEIGYREEKFELDDIEDLSSNLTFGGVFANAYIRF
jgi:outer membrane protein